MPLGPGRVILAGQSGSVGVRAIACRTLRGTWRLTGVYFLNLLDPSRGTTRVSPYRQDGQAHVEHVSVPRAPQGAFRAYKT